MFLTPEHKPIFLMRIFPIALVAIAFVGFAHALSFADGLAKVPPADFSKIQPSDFGDEELDMPYFVEHFHRLANAIVETGPQCGFFDIVAWRSERNNQTYNARVMENYLSLAYFYCTERPWNPYYGHPAVRERLEAALSYWLTLQSEDGRLSEYGVEEWNLAATAFATKFMGRTLTMLDDGPPIEEALRKQIIEADRKAIIATLTNEELYAHGRSFSNQFSNVWPGALSYLSLYPDPEIDALLRKRINDSIRDFQSPAGYYYEKDGPDWSYNLGTHHTNLEAARHFTSDKALLEIFAAKERLFYDWLSYNAVLEPDGMGFTMNRAIETRKEREYQPRDKGEFLPPSVPPAEAVELARAFSQTREERRLIQSEIRSTWEKEWPPLVAPLEDFGPYDFLARPFKRLRPTELERREATAKLPYLARERFVHQRADSRHPLVCTYIRRPSYYAAFNSGEIISFRQRYGLGILWNPAVGAVIQSQSKGRDTAWGTVARDADKVYEAQSFKPVFTISGKAIAPQAGARDLPDGPLTLSYQLGQRGKKTIVFAEDHVAISISHPGGFTENIPLLLGEDDELDINRARVELRFADGMKFVVTFDASAKPGIHKTESQTGKKSLRVLQLENARSLEYRLRFIPASEG
jgi:hypothetical protein